MKYRALNIAMLLSACLLVTTNASAVGVEKAIKGRQALMQIYAFNLGLVGAMAKGKAQYSSETAQNAADNLLAAATMKNGAMWPKGSDTDNLEFGEDTRALPEIWTTYPEIGQRGADLISALEEFVQVAGKDLDSMKKGLGSVGKGCKGCHKDFRAEKD